MQLPRSFRGVLVTVAIGVAASSLGRAQTSADQGAAPPALSADRVAAKGTSEALLTVERFGRYAIEAGGSNPVALQLVDRMAGPGPVVGTPGEENGRLDLFLDRGEYKLVAHGHPRGSGQATLAVTASAEQNALPAPQLVPLKTVAASLEDHQQRSYWIHLPTAEWVTLEAAGRALVDLRLWRDGTWLEDAEPSTEVVDPVAGRPLLVCRLAARLEPGLYLVTAYGGRPQPWAEDAPDFPFYLRRDIPRLAVAGRARHELSPFGIDRYLVPAKADFYRLELPEAVPTHLSVSSWSEQDPFAEDGAEAAIDKDSREPAAEVETSSRERGFELVVVRGSAGQPYVLQHFEARDQHRFSASGDYWVGTVHSGHGEDSVDATAILARWQGGRLDPAPLAEQTIPLDLASGWSTRCNLLDPLTVFLHVLASGTYVVEASGVAASFRVEPFLLERPRDYQSPPFQPAGSRFDLDAGFYVLTVEPAERGILDLALRPESLVGSLLELIGRDPAAASAVTAAVRFPSVPLSTRDAYVLVANTQPGVRTGLVLRRLPVDLGDALPLALRPGERVTVPFTVSEESVLVALAEDGSRLPLSVDGGEGRPEALVPAGRGAVVVRNDRAGSVVCSLGALPTRLLAATPLPPLPAATLAGLPELPLLDDRAPRSLDLARGGRTTFLLSAAEPALYRLESTGLLATEGTLRSRTITDLASSASGGSGRNFLLHQYLLAGDYQLTVDLRGRSAGHLGVHLERTTASDGGVLVDGRPARAEVTAGEALAYRFAVAAPGRFRLRARALGGALACRLEDQAGWPLVRPGQDADLTLDLAAGDYRLVLLPTPVAGRRVTLLEEVREAVRASGHGPHPLPVERTVEHVWSEPADGGERRPDQWTFTLPAASVVRVTVDGRMEGRLLDGSGQAVGDVVAGAGFSGPLAAGDYRLELVCARRDNRVDYRLQVAPEALVAGVERTVAAPTTVPVAIGEASLIELSSFGSSDVRARLVDADGAVAAAADDRTGDWNFLIAGRFAPGSYTLELEPVGTASAMTSVAMEVRPERLESALTVPAATTIQTGDDVVLVPLTGISGEVLLVTAEAEGASEAVGVAVEEATAGGWRTLASRVAARPTLAVALAGPTPLRLRLWSADRRGRPLAVQAVAVTPVELTESDLAAIARLPAVADFAPPLAVAAVRTSGPGTLRLGNGDDVLWAAAPGLALDEHHDGLGLVAGERAFLALPAPGGRVAVKAERVRLGPGERVQRGLEAGQRWSLDLAAGGGPLLVTARATVAQPLLRFHAGGMPASTVGPGRATAVTLATTPTSVEVWHDGRARADLGLSAAAFAPPTGRRVEWGLSEGRLEPGQAARLDLPAGQRRLTLTLDRGLVAVLADGTTVRSVHGGGDEAVTESLASAAASLIVLAPGPGGRFSADLVAAEPWPALAEGAPLVVPVSHTGQLRLGVAGGGQRTLHLAGAATAVTFVGDDGRLARGAGTVELGAGPGTLSVRHEPGLVLVWLGPRDEPARGLWPRGDERPERLALPARLDLATPRRAFRVGLDQASLLSLAVTGPCLVRVAPPAGPASHHLLLAAGARHLAVAAGAVEVGLVGLGGNALTGALEVSASALVAAGEGLGEAVLLAPGTARGFHFTVATAGPVGVGLRADPDTVEATLVDAVGAVVGRGVVQLHDLAVGDYVLVAALPAGSPPATVRPALVGLEPPPTGPPDEVIRSYVESSPEMEGER